MNVDKVVLDIRRLAIASDSFQQALSLLDHLQHLNLDINSDIYSPIMAGVVTTYAKNFNRADGLGPLPKSYLEFENEVLAVAHKQVIDSRNTLYSHRDLTKAPLSIIDAYKVQVWIENEHFLFKPNMVDLRPDRLEDIKKLVEYQQSRLKDDFDKKLISLKLENKYEENKVYILGQDFP